MAQALPLPGCFHTLHDQEGPPRSPSTSPAEREPPLLVAVPAPGLFAGPPLPPAHTLSRHDLRAWLARRGRSMGLVKGSSAVPLLLRVQAAAGNTQHPAGSPMHSTQQPPAPHMPG